MCRVQMIKNRIFLKGSKKEKVAKATGLTRQARAADPA